MLTDEVGPTSGKQNENRISDSYFGYGGSGYGLRRRADTRSTNGCANGRRGFARDDAGPSLVRRRRSPTPARSGTDLEWRSGRISPGSQRAAGSQDVWTGRVIRSCSDHDEGGAHSAHLKSSRCRRKPQQQKGHPEGCPFVFPAMSGIRPSASFFPLCASVRDFRPFRGRRLRVSPRHHEPY